MLHASDTQLFKMSEDLMATPSTTPTIARQWLLTSQDEGACRMSACERESERERERAKETGTLPFNTFIEFIIKYYVCNGCIIVVVAAVGGSNFVAAAAAAAAVVVALLRCYHYGHKPLSRKWDKNAHPVYPTTMHLQRPNLFRSCYLAKWNVYSAVILLLTSSRSQWLFVAKLNDRKHFNYYRFSLTHPTICLVCTKCSAQKKKGWSPTLIASYKRFINFFYSCAFDLRLSLTLSHLALLT